MQTTGLFDKRSASALLAKAGRDLERLRRDPTNSDAAFDFFITVRHIPSWIAEGRRAGEDAVYKANPGLQVARHLGDMAKHYQLDRPHHKQIEGTTVTSFSSTTSWLEDEPAPRHVIALMQPFAELLGFAETRQDVLAVAEAVYAEVLKLPT